MTQLIPCPGCNRHVRQAESSCPFCSTALSLADVPEHALPRTRLGRAATFAFGATLVGATLVGCGGESEEGKKTGGGGSAGATSQAGTASGGTSVGTGGFGLMYGAPPFGGTGNDDGGTGNGAGMTSGGTSVGGSGSPGPVYGAPSAGFSGVPLYGAAPAD